VQASCAVLRSVACAATWDACTCTRTLRRPTLFDLPARIPLSICAEGTGSAVPPEDIVDVSEQWE